MKADMTFYTAQADIVLQTLEQDGIYYVKRAYVDGKYGQTAWIFRTAYAAMNRLMQQRLPRPQEAESPVWLYADPRWAGTSADSHLLKLQVPADEIVTFDLRDWDRILNLSPIGTEEEIAAMEKEFARQGVAAFSDVFEKPYYPLLRQRIERTWKQLLEKKEIPPQYLQGAVWCLKREWIH
ncbi:MAG: DUF3841 domain-containing protein [Lachnospiraceae bacterium]|nr:DUF3841 domain-containing protein [Lachnospiraceae bacterium]